MPSGARLTPLLPALLRCCLLCEHTPRAQQQWTYNIVDGFVVPKMSATLPKPDPLFTAEAMAKWPQEFKDWQEAWAAAPKAAWDMPGAMWQMVARQLPQEHQDKVAKLGKLLHPKLALLPSVSITKREP
jgi:hypothetical protein